MVTWVVYDISSDGVRGKVAKMCKEYGLYRVQKSAFLGDMNKNEKDELLLRCKEIVDEENDSVYIFPMCDDDYRKVKMLGKAFDKDLVSDDVKALFV
jgi:CRISPR-associated protein Cas2